MFLLAAVVAGLFADLGAGMVDAGADQVEDIVKEVHLKACVGCTNLENLTHLNSGPYNLRYIP